MYTCTCGAPFAEHNPTHKSHHIPALWTVVRIFYPEIYGPFPSDTTGNYSNDAPNSLSPSTTSSDYNTVISSGNARNVSLTAASTSSHSAASTLSAIQHDTIQTLGCSSDGCPAQYPSHARQRVARRMRVSNTRIMGMRCTLSPLKAHRAHMALDSCLLASTSLHVTLILSSIAHCPQIRCWRLIIHTMHSAF